MNKKKSRHQLDFIDHKTIPLIPNKGKIIDAKIVKVRSGDEYTVIYFYGGLCLKSKIKVLSVDIPEKRVRGHLKGTELGKLEEKASFHIKEKLSKMLKGKIVKIRLDKFHNYRGKINGIIFLPSEYNNILLTDYLLENNLARPYDGNGKELWTIEELNYMLKS